MEPADTKDSIIQVLQLFTQREQERAMGKKGRILLQVIDGRLSYVDERKMTFFQRLFYDYSHSKLLNIVRFLQQQKQEQLAGALEALSLLDKKVEKHNHHLFSRKIFLATPLHELFKRVEPESTTTEESDATVSRTESSVEEEEETSLLGGIRNPGTNACYCNSVLQALRFCPTFTEFLDTKKGGLLEPLKKIYARLNSGREVDDIQAFRRLLKPVWPGKELLPGTEPLTSQQDAAAFCLFLFNTIGMPEFFYRAIVHYEHQIPVRSLDRQDGLTNNHLVLPVGDPQASLADIALQYRVDNTIEKVSIEKADGFIPTREQRALLDQMPAEITVPTLTTIEMVEGVMMPDLLPIFLSRYTAGQQKNRTPITVSEHIDFPLAEQTRKLARYRLLAAVVHMGGQSIHSGHYYTYVRHRIGDEVVWHKYNDSEVTPQHNVKKVLDEIATDGYLFFYEFDHFVDTSGRPLRTL